MSTIYPINYSFSGADCKAFAEVNKKTKPLQGLSTISISVHEAKSPVRKLGYRGAVAYTKAIRTIAGSMVFVLLNGQHPLHEVINASSYETPKSIDQKKWSTGIKEFNIQLRYSTEYVNSNKVFNDLPIAYDWINNYYTQSKSTEYKIKGVHLLNDGFVTSINDLVSEVVIQFTALDIEQMDEKNTITLSEYGAYGYTKWLKETQNSSVEIDPIVSKIYNAYERNQTLTAKEVRAIIESNGQ